MIGDPSNQPKVNFEPEDRPTGSLGSVEKPKPNMPPPPESTSNITPGPNGSVLDGGVFQSPNFSIGVSGWLIDSNGNVEFNDGTFRGTLSATTIDIGGSDSSSFHVDINGNMWLGAATYASAPFRVSNAGVLVSTSSTVNGSTLNGSVFYGSGSDGDVTISGNTSLTRNMYYLNLTVNTGVTLNPSGYQIFVKETLTINGTGKIARDGNVGANGTNGAGGGTGGTGGAALASGTLAGAVAGSNGGTGQTGVGDGSNSANSTTGSAGVAGVQGGTGGAGASFAGGTASAAGSATAAVSGIQNIAESIIFRNSLSASYSQITSSGGSSGGGGGGGDGAGSVGGGGGGAGSVGGVVGVYARTIVNNGTISAKGGAGGNGGTGQANAGGGGGGGGGSGGVLVLVYRSLTNNGTISVAGGAKGTGGTGGVSSGVDGTDGITGTLIQLQE